MHKIKQRQALHKKKLHEQKQALFNQTDTNNDVEKSTDSSSLKHNKNIEHFKKAGSILKEAYNYLLANLKSGKKIFDLCLLSDDFILSKVKESSELDVVSGLAFPTCLSVNDIAGHFCPLPTDKEAEITLKDNDLVTIEMGVHVDGFPVLLANSIVIGNDKNNKINGKIAKLLKGGYQGAKAALENLKFGNQNTEISAKVQAVVEEHGIKCIEGMVSHQVEKNNLEGPKHIIFNMKEDNKKGFKKTQIGEYEAYVIDVVVTTSSEGKLNLSQYPTRVLKCSKNSNYQLKMETSEKFIKEARKNFGAFPFAMRHISLEKTAKLGSVECIRNNVVEPYSVLTCKAGEYVAQFMFTALVFKDETIAVSFPTLDEDAIDQ